MQLSKLDSCLALIFLIGTRCEDLAAEIASTLFSGLPPQLHVSLLSQLCPHTLKQAVSKLLPQPHPSQTVHCFLQLLSEKETDGPSSSSSSSSSSFSSSSFSSSSSSISTSTSSQHSPSPNRPRDSSSKHKVVVARQAPRGVASGNVKGPKTRTLNPSSAASCSPTAPQSSLPADVQSTDKKPIRLLIDCGRVLQKRDGAANRPLKDANAQQKVQRPSLKPKAVSPVAQKSNARNGLRQCENCRSGTCLPCRKKGEKHQTLLPWH